MEAFLDSLWFKVMGLVSHVKTLLDGIFAPLNSLGPVTAILAIAFLTVLITKLLTKTIKTRRHKELGEQFSYWFKLRQEALGHEDPDKAKRLAKNIDQAKLNKVYYDYFFEGLMLSLVTTVLPILLFLAYVNEAYKPSNLLKLFGQEYVLKFMVSSGEEILVGAASWFVLSVLLIYVLWFVVKKACFRSKAAKKAKIENQGASSPA
jgi:uncharacterized membrane protein (DUF106 family)